MPVDCIKYFIHGFHFSYAGIIRIRLLGYNLSPYIEAPPSEKYRWQKYKKRAFHHFTISPFHHTFVIKYQTMKLLIINGPNLNLLGTREPDVYGNQSFESYLKKLRKHYHEIVIEYFQSNVEGEIINALQKAGYLIDQR